MPEFPDHDPRTPSEGAPDGDVDWFGFPLRPSPEELALIAELTELDRVDREAGRLDYLDFDAPPWGEAVVTDVYMQQGNTIVVWERFG